MTTDSSLTGALSVEEVPHNSRSGQTAVAIGKPAAWKVLAIVGLALTAGYIVFAPRHSWLPSPGMPDLRNNGLRTELRSCESFGVVNADVYYDGALSSDVIVFDLLDGGSEEARRIDPVHLLLQFVGRIDLNACDRVYLARNGQKKFYLSASDLRPLSDSYAGGGRVWSFNNLPQAARTPEGNRAYGEWTGGWLSVLQKQTEDLNHFIEVWTEK